VFRRLRSIGLLKRRGYRGYLTPTPFGSAELAALCAKLGRIPTVKEYMDLVPAKLAGKEDAVYKYLNFNEIENYHLEERTTAEEKYGVTVKPV